MQVLPDDIILRSDRSGTTTWVSERVLLGYCEGLSEDTLRETMRKRYTQQVPKRYRSQQVMPRVEGSWRWARLNGRFYYDLDTIPDKAPANYLSKLPKDLLEQHQNAVRQRAQTPLETKVKEALKKSSRFVGFFAHHGGHHAESLARAAAVIEATLLHMAEEQIPGNRMSFWLDLGAVLERLDVRYLPTNYRSLQRRFMPALECPDTHPTELVELPRTGNQNARKDFDPEVLAWTVAMRGMPLNYTGAHIVRAVQELCAMSGKAEPSASWLEKAVYSNETKYLTAPTRFGARGREANKWSGHIRLAPAPFASDCWMMDATRVNMIPVRVVDNKGGTAEKSVFMAAVTDVHSADCLAMTFTYSENRWAYRTLLAQASRAAGHLPFELVMDRYPGHNTQEGKDLIARLEAAGVKVTVTHRATGKATQERWWRTLQSVCFQHSEWYYGEGVQSKGEAAHRSAEHLAGQTKIARREGWGYEDLVKEVTHWLGRYRNTPLAKWSRQYRRCERSPAQMFAESPKPNAVTLAPERWAEMFSYETLITMRNQGQLTPEIGGIRLMYCCDDPHTIRKREGSQMVLCIDLENPEVGYLFEHEPGRAHKRYIGPVRQDMPVSRFGPGATYSGMGAKKKRLKELDEARMLAVEEVTAPLAAGEMTMLLQQLGGKAGHEAANDEWLRRELPDTGQADGYDEDEEPIAFDPKAWLSKM